MNQDRPNYYAIIPANVRYDQEISSSAKLLYGEITALCNEKGYCWANNAYFGKIYGVHPDTASSWISELERAGHIKLKGETIKRHIYLSVKTPIGKYTYNKPSTLGENAGSTLGENAEHNNTSINNTTTAGAESFDLKAAIQKLEDSEKRTDNIIALYWELTQPRFPTRKAAYAEWPMHLKHIKEHDLTNYTDKELVSTMKWLSENADFRWNLKTVGKYIIQDLSKLKTKRHG